MPDQVEMLALLRGAHLAATLSLLGVIGFIAWLLPAAGPDGRILLPQLVRLWRVSGMFALATLVAWFVVQAAVIAGATGGLNQIVAVLPIVAWHTRYGSTMLCRAGLLLVATLLAGSSRSRIHAALLLAGLSVGLQGLIGHAGAMGGRIGSGLVASEALHLLAAGLWLGSLAPLWISVGRLPGRAGAAVCERFSPIGLACVLVIAGSGLAQAIELIGGLAGLIGTHYGRIALAKIALFLVILVLAALNRFRLTDRLSQGVAGTVGWLRLSVASETVLGLAIILAAGFLASALPATHETPVWPLSWRPTLDALSDPSNREQMLWLLLPCAIAFLLIVAGLFWRPALWLSVALLAGSLLLARPKLAALLTVDAYPTSFAASPTEFADSSIVRGATLFAANCARCHGAEGKGDGPDAKALPVAPADLTAAHFRAHTEGDLYWYISQGRNAASGVAAMPAFGSVLSSGDRWALIDFLKANNAGHGVGSSGRWDLPTPMPQFDAICPDGSTIDLDDLRGRVVHVIADPRILPSVAAPADDLPVTTLLLSLDRKAKPIGGACVTAEPVAAKAFSVLLGVSLEDLPRTQALADQDGWLRIRGRIDDGAGWNDPPTLAAMIRDIVTHPLTVTAAGGHAHHR